MLSQAKEQQSEGGKFLYWRRRLSLDNWRGDLFGGLTTAIVSLPMALAFGVASGAGPVAGLYGAVCVGFFAALFGGTPTLISEPTGPMTVMMTAVIANVTARYPDQGLALAFTVVMLGGLFQLLFGALKLGKYITLMPYSVISGFMSGIGWIMILLQIPPILGQVNRGGVIGAVQNLPEYLLNLKGPELGLGLLTIGILFFYPKPWRRVVPPQLVALLVGTLVASLFMADLDLRRIGPIPTSLPQLQWPRLPLSSFASLVLDGVVLGMLGCIDTLLTAVIADNLTRTRHDSDQELIGQGIANIVSGLLGGLPGAGATMGTVVNIQSGGRTPLSGMTRAGILLMVVLFAAPLTQGIPMAVLAGIALKVGVDILDWSFLKRAHRLSLKGAAIMYGVMFMTVFVDLIAAVGVGVFVANLLTIQRLSEIHSEEVKAITDADDAVELTPQEKTLLRQAQGQVLLFYLSGPMIFGVSQAISRQHQAVASCQALVLDLSDVPMLGVSATLSLENAIRDALDQRKQVWIVGAKGRIRQRLENLHLPIPPERFVDSRELALAEAVTQLGLQPQPSPLV
ncbi:SulP family inorganic anion transporter [Thermostichus vulcanus]|uniref:SulP family inorganic anion transporter n=1 Tax=Thermostichus vulcanus str. 'Rupite' TaxID=2813851 RepID=A0ABT0CEM8_THEVL|nr:SulP family inorganic anion transporter [Thermostichus vulcanus]MCJ2544239.1 SulP family inorganic anion transporter [Thermostichus vulcanus str. 'Rupite']